MADALDLAPTPLARLADALQRRRYGGLDDRGLADALRGWRAWYDRQIAAYPAHADGIGAIFDTMTAWPRAEAQRRVLRRQQPAGARLTTEELVARYGDRLRPAGSDRWRTCCPWHHDERPSLYVFARGWCHCFSCQEHRPVGDLAAAWAKEAA